VREVIQQQNLSAAKQYDQDYDQYMKRYCTELDKCDSAEKLRALGHWAPKHPLGKEPGYDASNTSDPFANKWADERITKTRGDKEARELAAKKMCEFTGRQPMGDVFAEVEVGAKVEYVSPNKVVTGGAVKAGATAGSESGVKPDAGVEAYGGVEAGPVKVTVGAEKTAQGDGTPVKYGQVEFKGSSVQGKEDGTVEAKVNISGKEDVVYGPYGSNNPATATSKAGVHGAVSKKTDLPNGGKVTGEVNGKAGVGLRGITADEAYESIRPGPGYWSNPAELDQGVPWKQLPPQTQERYAKHYGWTEKEWESKRKPE
jgi:hypothetical protein